VFGVPFGLSAYVQLPVKHYLVDDDSAEDLEEVEEFEVLRSSTPTASNVMVSMIAIPLYGSVSTFANSNRLHSLYQSTLLPLLLRLCQLPNVRLLPAVCRSGHYLEGEGALAKN
jgi:hypothetical protein